MSFPRSTLFCHFRSLPHLVIPAVFWAGIQSFCCMASLKSGSLLLDNPFCLLPGRLNGSPTTTLGDDGKDVVISVACHTSFIPAIFPTLSFPRSVGRESSIQVFGSASWIPEYYLGDDGIKVVIPKVCWSKIQCASCGNASTWFPDNYTRG